MVILTSYKYLFNQPKSTWLGSPDVTPMGYIGFIYEVVEKSSGFRYVGIKRFWEKKTLKPLKGKKNKRKFLQESDWRTYNTSGVLKPHLEKHPKMYEKRIIHMCETLTELKAYEAYLILNDYFGEQKLVNEMVQVRLRLRKKPKDLTKTFQKTKSLT